MSAAARVVPERAMELARGLEKEARALEAAGPNQDLAGATSLRKKYVIPLYKDALGDEPPGGKSTDPIQEARELLALVDSSSYLLNPMDPRDTSIYMLRLDHLKFCMNHVVPLLEELKPKLRRKRKGGPTLLHRIEDVVYLLTHENHTNDAFRLLLRLREIFGLNTMNDEVEPDKQALPNKRNFDAVQAFRMLEVIPKAIKNIESFKGNARGRQPLLCRALRCLHLQVSIILRALDIHETGKGDFADDESVIEEFRTYKVECVKAVVELQRTYSDVVGSPRAIAIGRKLIGLIDSHLAILEKRGTAEYDRREHDKVDRFPIDPWMEYNMLPTEAGPIRINYSSTNQSYGPTALRNRRKVEAAVSGNGSLFVDMV